MRVEVTIIISTCRRTSVWKTSAMVEAERSPQIVSTKPLAPWGIVAREIVQDVHAIGRAPSDLTTSRSISDILTSGTALMFPLGRPEFDFVPLLAMHESEASLSDDMPLSLVMRRVVELETTMTAVHVVHLNQSIVPGS